MEIKEVFDREGIEIPFPHVGLYSGDGGKPIVIKLEEEKRQSELFLQWLHFLENVINFAA